MINIHFQPRRTILTFEISFEDNIYKQQHKFKTETPILCISRSAHQKPNITTETPISKQPLENTELPPSPIIPNESTPPNDQPTGFKKIQYFFQGYKSLSKAKLSSLVLATTMVGYGMAPGAFELSTFLIVSIGTCCTICSANSINQILEVHNDSQMFRTKKRWLPTNKITVNHAKMFATFTGLAGVGSLLLINPLTSALAAFNLFLYTAVYTPLKQKKPVNTWIGAIVGAIPPMIGWAAGTGGIELGSWIIGALLAFWQMPHFMALSYSLREDYHRGGFKMLINTNPEKVPGVILRYSIAMLPLGLISSLCGMTTWFFAIDSLLPTGYLTYLALKFKKKQDKDTARSIFKFSLLMLPVFMFLMCLHKNPSPSHATATFTQLKKNVISFFSDKKNVNVPTPATQANL